METAQKVKLPNHKAELPVGSVCPNTTAENIAEDIGLLISLCPACGRRFIFSFKNNSWIPEEEFEENLKKNPPNINGI